MCIDYEDTTSLQKLPPQISCVIWSWIMHWMLLKPLKMWFQIVSLYNVTYSWLNRQQSELKFRKNIYVYLNYYLYLNTWLVNSCSWRADCNNFEVLVLYFMLLYTFYSTTFWRQILYFLLYYKYLTALVTLQIQSINTKYQSTHQFWCLIID